MSPWNLPGHPDEGKKTDPWQIIKKAWWARKALKAVRQAWEGSMPNVGDKPAGKSMAVWGGVLGALGAFLVQLGATMEGALGWGEFLAWAAGPQGIGAIVSSLGILAGTFGLRRAVGRGGSRAGP